MTPTLVVAGDVLLDRDLDGAARRLCPDAPAPVVEDLTERARPGGAGLAALLAARDGHDVTLVTALAADAPADTLRAALDAAGVRVVEVARAGETVQKVRVRVDGRSLLRLDYGCPGTAPVPSPAGLAALPALLGDAAAVLVADYGRGVADLPALRAALTTAARRVPTVWDPHPHGGAPTAGVRVVTPNAAEARTFAGDVPGDGLPGDVARARALCARWDAGAVAVTRGAAGAVLVGADGTPTVLPAPAVDCRDACGAGDRFSSVVAGQLAAGALPAEAVAAAVAAASEFVAGGGAAAVTGATGGGGTALPAPGAPAGPAARRSVTVATGGCFDVLHAGHLATLQAARGLGDRLVVLLNSDASVRRLKGAGRPVNSQADRASVLRALRWVDDVVVFDEDTPQAALRRLRPQIWAKGGDYTIADLPEASTVAEWGGQAVILPYLSGRSTTAILQEAARRAS